VNLADLSVEERDGVVVAHVRGEIDLSNAAAIGAGVQHAVTNDSPGVVLDLTGTTYLDSAAIHAIYQLADRLRRRNQVLAIALVEPGAAASTLRLTGVYETVPVRTDVASALAAVPRG